MADCLQFTQREQEYPDLKDAATRKQHFDEIYTRFDPDRAAEQAARCSQCGVPMCQVHCPVSNNIPDWLMLTAEGRLQEAYQISAATNNFPEICGRICPQDKLCEGNCVIEAGFGSVTIGSVEKYLTENAFDNGWVTPIIPESENGLSVGIVGAGPAGLAAAEQLRKAGYEVHVYDRYDRVGGLMMYGIPNFKLDKHVVTRREALMRESNIQFHLGCAIGETLPFDELRSRHRAVLIATGVYRARGLSLPHDDYDNILPALDYLTASNRKGLGDNVDGFDNGRLNAEGKKVVVIGGGDTAMDCVRTAVRQGATSVTCLYRRDRENMPGSAREVKNAEEEGVIFEWLSAPKSFKGAGRVNEVMVEKMRLGSPDKSGRLAPIAMPDSLYGMSADMVITALGFEPEDLPHLWDAPALQLSKWGTLAINPHMMTSLEGVFAAGDIARGASLVVWAIRDGRDAAASIHQYLMQQQAISKPASVLQPLTSGQ